MKDRSSDRPAWSVPTSVADTPETGQHIDLVADGPARAAVAKIAGVHSVDRLQASFDLTRQGRDGVRVVGQVSALVGQHCVVTLEPLHTAVEEAVDLVYLPRDDVANAMTAGDAGSEEPPEALQDGVIDLGAVATEFLILGIDPYPRKPGVAFEPPAVAEDQAAHPFAALAALKKNGGN